jgi:hypothetical protein
MKGRHGNVQYIHINTGREGDTEQQGIVEAERHSRGNMRLTGRRVDGKFRFAAIPGVPPTHCIHIERTEVKLKALAFAPRAGHGIPFA